MDRELIAEASNPQTSSERLGELCRHYLYTDDEVAATLARNPAMEISVLHKLAERFPGEVLRNPQLRECSPDWVRGLSTNAVQALLSQNPLPKWMLDEFVDWYHSEVRELAKLHVQLAGEAGLNWRDEAQDAFLPLQKMGLREPDGHVWYPWPLIPPEKESFCPWFLKEEFFQIKGSPPPPPNPAPPPPRTPTGATEVWRLENNDSLVRLDWARDPNASVDALKILALDEDREVLEAVARHPKYPQQFLPLLRRRIERTERWGISRRDGDIASSASAPVELIHQMARDVTKPWKVRKRAIKNRLTTGEVLGELASDPDPVVRHAIAKHRRTPANVLERLAMDDVPEVRWAALRHATVPESVLEQTLAQHHQTLDSWYLDFVAVAANPNLPEHTVDRLAVELFRTSTGEHLTPFGGVDNPWSNRGTAILDMYWQQAAQALAANPSTPIRLRARLRLSQIRWFVSMLSNYDNVLLRAIALSHYLVPEEKMTVGAKSHVWQWRFAVATNSNAPRHLLHLLAQDGHRLVRAAARERMT